MEANLRDFVFDDNDIDFSYKLLCDRYNNKNSIIKHITTPALPTKEEHIYNLKKIFRVLKIARISNFDVGFMTIDRNNFIGGFYDYSKLKYAFKSLGIKKHNKDISSDFIKLLSTFVPKDTILFCRINPRNITAVRATERVYDHIANLYAYKA